MELARRLASHCGMKARSSNSTRCDIRKGEVSERSSAIIQTHGVLMLSREPPEAKDEDRHKGLEIGKHRLSIITTLGVAGELSRWRPQEKCAASRETGDSDFRWALTTSSSMVNWNTIKGN
jgi:hypothetical protein